MSTIVADAPAAAASKPRDEARNGVSGQEEACTFSLDLRPDLPAREVERRFQEASRAGDLGRRAEAFWAAEIVSRRLHEDFGKPCLEAYARARLRVSAETLERKARVQERLAKLPQLDRMFAAEELRWSVVRLLVKVATPETQTAWGEWARGRTEREVRATTRGRAPGPPPGPDGRSAVDEIKVTFQARGLTTFQHRLVEDMRERAAAELGGRVSSAELLMWLVGHAWDGEEAPNAERIARLDPRNHGPLVPPEDRDAPTGVALRDAVLARHGHRCAACGSQRGLFVHHLHWRRYGGPTTADNLIPLCKGCHSLVHARRLILVGAAESLELFDEEGEPVGVYRPTGMRFRVPGDAGRADGEDATKAESAPAVVDALPSVVDPAWWRRHQDLLRWDRQRGGLVFEAGAPGPEPAGDGPDRRRAAAEGPGLDDLIGQERVRGSLRVAVAASRAGGGPLGHTLLAGPPGLGKTTLARALARDARADLHQVLASTIRDPELLVRHLCGLEPGDVLFLDEVHGLPPPVAEVLYDALEQGALNLPLAGEGWRQRALRIELPPFTLVGATTEPDELPAPLLSPFVYQERLDFQEPAALAELVARTAARQGFEPSREAAELLAGAARGTPRVALGLLRAARDQALAEGADRLDAAVARRALERTGVEASGITRAERRYLDLLGAAAGCLGLSTLAARLGESARTVQRRIEPFLLRGGWVEVTPRGRRLAPAPT